MKNLPVKLFIAFSIAGFSTQAFSEGQASGQMCDKPQKTVMLGNVSCTAALCKMSGGAPSGGLGALIQLAQASGGMPNVSGLSSDLSSILASSLRQTKCFDVLEQEGIEQARAQMATLGKTFTPPKVDYIVNANISEVDIADNQQNILFVKVGNKSAKLTMDTKVIDPNTGSILDTKSYSSSTSDAAARFEVGGLLRVGQGNSQLGLTDLVRDTSMQASKELALQFK